MKPNREVNENRGFAPETVIRTLAKTDIELREQLAIYGNATVTPRSIKYLTTLANGAPEEIRTPDPQIRSLVLYPAELRARFSLAFQGARPADAACDRDTFRKVAKARHSYRLQPGLARSGKRLLGAIILLVIPGRCEASNPEGRSR